ncbi:hypothetical protein PUN28_009460 [Cardiocondyla obscurior]|uniref:Uncharacterized protein n=1 Tax=Cardiocondyla obscurior TaxID=286306 RepID=A0AAW2FS56_9HYME
MLCRPHPKLSTIPNRESISKGKTSCSSVVLDSSISTDKSLHLSTIGSCSNCNVYILHIVKYSIQTFDFYKVLINHTYCSNVSGRSHRLQFPSLDKIVEKNSSYKFNRLFMCNGNVLYIFESLPLTTTIVYTYIHDFYRRQLSTSRRQWHLIADLVRTKKFYYLIGSHDDGNQLMLIGDQAFLFLTF